jgi:hypothetical protein
MRPKKICSTHTTVTLPECSQQAALRQCHFMRQAGSEDGAAAPFSKLLDHLLHVLGTLPVADQQGIGR